jgi:6-phosphogluconolactonase
MARFVFIGSYTKDDDQTENRPDGIYTCQVSDDGQLTLVLSNPSGLNPSYLALHPTRPFLYAVNELEANAASAFAINPQSGALTLLNSQPTGGVWPCQASVDPSGRWLMVANYKSGSLTIFPILPLSGGQLGPASDYVEHQGVPGPDVDRQEGAHAHMIKFDPTGRFVLASDLGLDRIFIYRLNGEIGRLEPADPAEVVMPAASGPRHFVFHPNGRFLYLANELDSSVTACQWDGQAGRLQPFQKLPTLPGGYEGVNDVADIHLHPSGRFLYVSNRGHNSLAIFSVDPHSGLLEAIGNTLSGGLTPRGFNVDPLGEFILVANQHSDNVVTLRIDQASGLLHPTEYLISLPQPVCVLFHR